ncbi:MAG: DUF389 domain-containing protein [Candidatus Magasanikbacteria bacterium]
MSFLTSHTDRIRMKTEIHLNNFSTPSINFFVLIGLASAIAALGLLLDNTAVVIGAMVVAPLVTPVFALALSILLLKIKRAGKALGVIFMGTVLAVFISTILGHLIILIEGEQFRMTSEIISRTKPNLLFFLVALCSGAAGAYAYGRPKIMESITGIAISVAVIPPLAVVGLEMAAKNYALASQSFLLYLLNLAGITFGSILMFLILGFGKE